LTQERLSMRKIKEVLRLHSLGRKQREVARSCSISQSTVHEYLKAADAAGKSWPEIADWDEVQLEMELSSQRPAPIGVLRTRFPILPTSTTSCRATSR
jgi:DNA-binding transcriptional regulator LsrR (DeoR family)